MKFEDKGARGRRAITIDDKATYLPNAYTIGYGKYEAKAGDLITVCEDGVKSWGRVVGRIKSSDCDGEDGMGKLLVIIIGSNASFGMERWINADDVIGCEEIGRAAQFLNWFINCNVEGLWQYRKDYVVPKPK